MLPAIIDSHNNHVSIPLTEQQYQQIRLDQDDPTERLVNMIYSEGLSWMIKNEFKDSLNPK